LESLEFGFFFKQDLREFEGYEALNLSAIILAEELLIFTVGRDALSFEGGIVGLLFLLLI